MLRLKKIVKNYETGATTVRALRGVSVDFRDNEFVAILGPSGCGKTTLLNIIGGLDGYTDGDLLINGKSTKNFGDRDWDTYRNHSIGFVFQNYNLIPHQTVLSNVELALTLSGVPKAERRRRAAEALAKVGLGDQLHKKPTQMSGGQMQRVAIARALVNDPEIILADEPTGALDTETSIQVMNILKEVANDRLVIMVTHNPELAEEYSTRIIRMLDGEIIGDSNPLAESEYETAFAREKEILAKEGKKKQKKPSMSFATSFMLSLKNLFTKRGRTILTSFAGSIGIIGIALIIAVSSGVNAFIDQVQKDTLSTYPLTIQKETQDMSAMLSAMTNSADTSDYKDSGKIHVNDSLGSAMSAMSSTVTNNLEAFKTYIENNSDKLEGHLSDIQYTYDYDLQIYSADGKVKVGMETIFEHMGDAFSGMSEMMEMGGSSIDVFSEMINDKELLNQQYDVIAGEWPSEANEVILVVNSNNQLSKMTLYMLGILDPNDIEEELAAVMRGEEPTAIEPFEYDYFLNLEFLLLTTADFYEKVEDIRKDNPNYKLGQDAFYDDGKYPIWNDLRDIPGFDQEAFVKEHGATLKISGIVRPKAGATATSISGAVGYTRDLTDLILGKSDSSIVINQQKKTPNVNVLTGLPFERTHYTPENIGELINKIDDATMDMFYAYMTEQILTNPEFSDRINASDMESFLGIYMLLPAENQAEIFEKVLAAAKESTNPMAAMSINGLCQAISQMTNGIPVTPDNIVRLLPVLDVQHVMVAFAGIPKSEQVPFDIPGLIQIAGEEKMSVIYKEITETIKTMQVNKEIFVTILSTLKADDEAFVQLEETLYSMAPQIDATYKSVLKTLDAAEEASPASINFYAKDFESKEVIESFIADYNAALENEEDEIKYTDLVGTLMSSVTIIVNAISYVLIAFVAISLIVSSIMIGVITLISVQERTKEIGILRAIGASKRNVSSMFNAETIIVGFAAGLLGVLITYLLCIPINMILFYFTGIANLQAQLPIGAALILVVISVILTLFAGIIPSSSAAKKDPVVALRTE